MAPLTAVAVGEGRVLSHGPASGSSGLFGNLRHRNDIQGLRAIAVLLVVLDHAGVPFLQGGYIGVDVFFVLSGFLITGLLLSGACRQRRGRVARIGEFYARRARRILPVACLTLVTTDLVAYHLLNFVRAKQVLLDSISAALSVANIRFAAQGTDYFQQAQAPSPIEHFWSLSVEEQFYLLWPVVLVVVLFGVSFTLRRRSYQARTQTGIPSRRRVSALLAVISVAGGASLGWSIYLTHRLAVAAYFSTSARAWELALGAGLAVLTPKLARLPRNPAAVFGWLGLTCILASAVLFSAATPFPGSAALLPCVGAALVIGAGIAPKTARWDAARLLSTAPMRYIGDRSYTIYLWHWPMLILAAQYEGHSLSLRVNLGILLAAVLVSIVTYRFFENPLRRAEWSGVIKPLLLWPACVLTVLLVAGVSINSITNKEDALQVAARTASSVPDMAAAQAAYSGGAKVPQGYASADSLTLSAVVAAVQAANRAAPLPSPLAPAVGNLSTFRSPSRCTAEGIMQTSSQVCRLGDVASRRTILVFGDSHAEMWMPAILGMAQQDGWAVVPLIKWQCLSAKLFSFSYAMPRWLAHNSYCSAWYKWALSKVQALHPSVILMGTMYGGFQGNAAEAVRTAISQVATTLGRYSKHVILIADDEGISQDPVNCLLAPRATMRTCTDTIDPARTLLNDELAQASGLSRAFGLIKTRGWFCYHDECPLVVGNTVVYVDIYGHITGTYAREMTQPFRSAFRAA